MSRTLIIAQGSGYYGCTFFTSKKDFSEVRDVLKKCANFAEGEDGFGIMYNNTNVFVRNWNGESQPNPVVLFDTGNSNNELNSLWYVKGLLGEDITKYDSLEVIQDLKLQEKKFSTWHCSNCERNTRHIIRDIQEYSAYTECTECDRLTWR